MKVALVLKLGQSQELLPIQSYRILDMTVDFELPFIQRNFGPDAQIEHWKIMHLPLARWQAVGRAHRRPFLAGHLPRPAFFGFNAHSFATVMGLASGMQAFR